MIDPKILETLKEGYGFRENHILILEALDKKDMTADQICKATNIPKGRIYDFLNFLLDSKIAGTRGKHPKIYSLKPISEHIKQFLQDEFQRDVSNEISIRKAMGLEEKRITSISSQTLFISLLRRVLVSRKRFRVVTSLLLPHMFYTDNDTKFNKFSKYFLETELALTTDPIINTLTREAFWQAYNNAEEFTYILDLDIIETYKTALTKLFSKKEGKEMLKNIRNLLEKKIINVYISKVKNPFYMLVTENEVFLVVKAQSSVEGVLIGDNEIADVYRKMFKEQVSKSENLLLIWEKTFEE